MAGPFVTALGVGRTVAIVPVGWAADRFDERTVMFASLVVSTLAYPRCSWRRHSDSSARMRRNLGLVGTGMVSLTTVGDRAGSADRGRQIGTSNAWRMAAGIVGSTAAGALFDMAGFPPTFVVMLASREALGELRRW